MAETDRRRHHAQLFELLRQQELNSQANSKGRLKLRAKISLTDAKVLQSQALASFKSPKLPFGAKA